MRTSISAAAGIAASAIEPADVHSASVSMWNAYAQTLYIHEILKGRQGQITGRVRFDIAPGSTIQMAAAQDKYSGDGCNDPEQYFAEVLRVSTIIDSQNCRASTSFHLAYIRSEDEDYDPTTSIAYNPLYPTTWWSGCVLVNDPAFAPTSTHFHEGE